MTETNELQPKPETDLQAAEVQAAPAPEDNETQVEETTDVLDGSAVETASAEQPAPAEEPAAEEPATEEAAE